MLLLGEIGLDYYWKPYDSKCRPRCFVRQMEIAARPASRSASILGTRGTTPWSCSGRTGLSLDCLASCTALRATGAGAAGARPWFLFELLRCGHLPQGDGRPRVGADWLRSTGCWWRPMRRILRPCRYRGKRNEPSYVAHTFSQLLNCAVRIAEDLVAATVRNFDTIVG